MLFKLPVRVFLKASDLMASFTSSRVVLAGSFPSTTQTTLPGSNMTDVMVLTYVDDNTKFLAMSLT